jgi:hypothetical protein
MVRAKNIFGVLNGYRLEQKEKDSETNSVESS